MSAPIAPGATLGVFGGGQLGRMFTMAARRLGYRVHVLVPENDSPSGQVADVEVNAAFDDVDAIRRFVDAVDVVTYEFENVPAVAAEVAEQRVPVRPAGRILALTQNRLAEKSWLQDHGFPVTSFARVDALDDLHRARAVLGPAILKTAAWGYDGKGQQRVEADDDLEELWAAVPAGAHILERHVDFDCELSVVLARGLDGRVATYGPMRNVHANHILDVSSCPADVSPALARGAVELARAIADALDYVGVLCVELFATRAGDLLVNELAPRPHNSGHLTIDAHMTCQFEQQVRAICGLPLGDATLRMPAAMANLLGDLWANGPPRWVTALAAPDVKLHLYGKHTPRPGRKMGHLTVLASSAARAGERARQVRDTLSQAG